MEWVFLLNKFLIPNLSALSNRAILTITSSLSLPLSQSHLLISYLSVFTKTRINQKSPRSKNSRNLPVSSLRDIATTALICGTFPATSICFIDTRCSFYLSPAESLSPTDQLWFYQNVAASRLFVDGLCGFSRHSGVEYCSEVSPGVDIILYIGKVSFVLSDFLCFLYNFGKECTFECVTI